MSLGVFLASVGFIILDSKDFCNLFRSVPQDYGFVTIAGKKSELVKGGGNPTQRRFNFNFSILIYKP